ncbi:MAG TPA: hypothetical protein VHG93_02725, partial [Longimicrobium sp.]|nr:hypothetical protein [Longimicrobium sp.]
VNEDELVPTGASTPGEPPVWAAPDPPETRHEGPSALLRRRLAELDELETKLLDLPAAGAAEPPTPMAPVSPITAAPVPAPEPAVAAAAEPGERRAAGPPRRGIELYNALLTVMWSGIVFTLLGVVVGAVHAMVGGVDVPRTAAVWGILGGILGLVLGVWVAAVHIIEYRNGRRL